MKYSEKNGDKTILMVTRDLLMLKQHGAAIALIARGYNIWSGDVDFGSNDSLSLFRRLYLFRFAAFPTNTQFVERAVKEAGFVTLGRRSEATRTQLVIARGQLISQALQSGCREIEEEEKKRMAMEDELEGEERQTTKKRRLGGKRRTKFLMKEILNHQVKMSAVAKVKGQHEFSQQYKKIRHSLCDDTFEKKRLGKKLDKLKKAADDTAHLEDNTANGEMDVDETFTPYMLDRICYKHIRRDDNMEQIRMELQARGVSYENGSNWTTLIGLLKSDEGDKLSFKPTIDFDLFTLKFT